GLHEFVQGLQHQAVAAERHDDVGVGRGYVAIAAHEYVARHFGFGYGACDERDAIAAVAHECLVFHCVKGCRGARGMDRAVFVYTTFPSVVEAEKAGNALVGARLAACVNILPGMISVYRWQGAVERAEEAVMIVKTRASLAEAVRASVKATHPYNTPA